MNVPPDEPFVAVRVWDLPTRLFHWSLALLVTANVVTGKFDSVLGASTLEWHKRFGIAILALLAFRLVWGIVGGTHARFATFLRGPRAVAAYAKSLASRGYAVSVGHNPMGGWSVVAMVAALGVQATTGLFLVQEDYGFTGPLSRFVSGAFSSRMGAIHEANFWVIAALVAMHLAAIVAHGVLWRENLVSAMVSGVKRLPARFSGADGRKGGWSGLIASLAVAAVVASVLVKLG